MKSDFWFVIFFPIFSQVEGTNLLWIDCTWFCKVLRRTREWVLYLGWL